MTPEGSGGVWMVLGVHDWLLLPLLLAAVAFCPPMKSLTRLPFLPIALWSPLVIALQIGCPCFNNPTAFLLHFLSHPSSSPYLDQTARQPQVLPKRVIFGFSIFSHNATLFVAGIKILFWGLSFG